MLKYLQPILMGNRFLMVLIKALFFHQDLLGKVGQTLEPNFGLVQSSAHWIW